MHIIHQPLNVFFTIVGQGNGFADMEAVRPFVDAEASLRGDAMASVDGHRYDITAGFKGQVEAAPFKGLQVAVRASGAFRENEHRGTVSDPLCRQSNAFDRFSGIFSFDADVTGTGHGGPQEGYFHEFLFQDELKIHRKKRQDGPDIEETLMIAHVDAGNFWIHIFKAAYRDANTADPQDDFGPGYGAPDSELDLFTAVPVGVYFALLYAPSSPFFPICCETSY
jgi:hypothetical protein